MILVIIKYKGQIAGAELRAQVAQLATLGHREKVARRTLRGFGRKEHEAARGTNRRLDELRVLRVLKGLLRRVACEQLAIEGIDKLSDGILREIATHADDHRDTSCKEDATSL